MAYTPTGFPLGRPRKGEIRPLTPGAENQRKRREKLKRKNPKAFNQFNAIYQQLWQLANPGAKSKTCRKYKEREAQWVASRGKRRSVTI